MDVNKMIGMVVGVVVGLIVMSAALFPTIDQATTTNRTITNIGDYYVLENPDEVTITYEDSVLTINDEIIPVPNAAGNGYGVSVLSLGNGVLRYTPNGQLIKWGSITPYSSVPIVNATISISEGVLSGTVTYSGSETPASISATITGDYYVLQTTKNSEIMTLSTTKTYVLEDTIVQSNGVTNVDGNAVYGTCVFDVIGSIKDGFTVKAYNRNAGTDITSNLGIDNITVNATKVNGYKDLYLLDSVTFTTTTDADTPVTSNVAYQYFAAPTELSAELAVHASQDEIEILETIPILITVGLILGIVGAVFVRRLE